MKDRLEKTLVSWLSRRPRTEHEVRKRLEEGGHETGAVDAVIERLRRARQVDDLGLSVHYIQARGSRRSLGRHRLLRELEGRGVPAGIALKAWEQAVCDGDLDPDALLRRAVERRVAAEGGRLDVRAYRRVYNALTRAGFEASEVVSRLESHRAQPDTDDLDYNETNDDEIL